MIMDMTKKIFYKKNIIYCKIPFKRKLFYNNKNTLTFELEIGTGCLKPPDIYIYKDYCDRRLSK